jgi:hypothetical protein
MSTSPVESVITGVEKFKIQSRNGLKSAPSLRPGLQMMDGCVCGNPEALAIRNAWKFSHPVRIVSRDEFAAMVARNQVVFHG